MSEDCFAPLIAYGKRFDEGIKKLAETWRYPQNIFGGYGADDLQAEADLQILKFKITTLKDKFTEDEESKSNHIREMDRFLEESQQMTDELVQSCDDIETVLSEYGYVNPEDESSVNKMETEYSINSSLISSDVTDELLEVQFTPDMTWRQKARTTTVS